MMRAWLLASVYTTLVSSDGHLEDACSDEPAYEDESHLMEVRLLQILQKVGRKSLTSSTLGADSADASGANGSLSALVEAPAAQEASRSAQIYRQPMRNHGDLSYTATVTVGGQEIQGILDTGSFELLVFSTRCRTCGSVAAFYNTSASGSYKDENVMQMHSFGSGDTRSQMGYEDVRLGPLRVQSQYFWEVYEAQLPVLHQGAFQAIVGVGPPTTVRSNVASHMARAAKDEARYVAKGRAVPSSVAGRREASETLANQAPLLESLDVHRFSVCLQRGAGEEGYFIWSDDGPDQYPDRFKRLELVDGNHWAVDFRDVKLEHGSDDADIAVGCSDGCSAVVDSGTSLIVVPTQVGAEILRLINGLDTATCNDISSFPDLTFDIGGHRLHMRPETYIGEVFEDIPEELRQYASQLELPRKFVGCELLLMTMDIETDLGPMWILGMPFFREYYTTFDLGPDFLDSSGRSLYVARADAQCKVAQESDHQVMHAIGSTSLPSKRRIDMSQVRVPGWAMGAARDGFYSF